MKIDKFFVTYAIFLVIGLMVSVALVKSVDKPALRVPDDCQSLAGVRRIPPALEGFAKACDQYYRGKYPDAKG